MKILTRVCSLLLAICLATLPVSVMAKESRIPFTDIDNWAKDSICWAYNQGIVLGTSSTTFSPDLSVTRAEFVVMLWRLEGKPLTNQSKYFYQDFTPEIAFSYDAIMWATENEIIFGIGNNQFGPNLQLQRQDVATILRRYFLYKQNKILIDEVDVLSKYEDAKEISTYAIDAMKWAISAALITGRTNKLLCAKSFTTRAEVVAILHRYTKIS